MQRLEYSVSLWSFVITCLIEEMTVITTARKEMLKTNNNMNNIIIIINFEGYYGRVKITNG